jgi:hypothetical protein
MKHHPILSIKARTLNQFVKHYNFTKYYRYMKQIRNTHLGESCFVIGNGPSLTAEDLDTLAENHIDSFAVNRIYKIFPQTKWRPTYYVNTDWVLIRDVLDTVNTIPAKQKFFPIHHLYEQSFRKEIKNRAIFNLRYSPESIFNIDCSQRVQGVGTVTISSIQLAAHMGYRNIYLLGIDHNFDNIIDENGNTIINEGVKNYFVDDYDTDISDEVVHNLGNTTRRYCEVQAYYPKHGVIIHNATRTTKLEAFPRIDFDEAVEKIIRK